MRAIKKNNENLVNVAKSICEVNFSSGHFVSDYRILGGCVVLSSLGRDAIGCSIIRLIPSNYDWRVSFSNDGMTLSIWI